MAPLQISWTGRFAEVEALIENGELGMSMYELYDMLSDPFLPRIDGIVCYFFLALSSTDLQVAKDHRLSAERLWDIYGFSHSTPTPELAEVRNLLDFLAEPLGEATPTQKQWPDSDDDCKVDPKVLDEQCKRSDSANVMGISTPKSSPLIPSSASVSPTSPRYQLADYEELMKDHIHESVEIFSPINKNDSFVKAHKDTSSDIFNPSIRENGPATHFSVKKWGTAAMDWDYSRCGTPCEDYLTRKPERMSRKKQEPGTRRRSEPYVRDYKRKVREDEFMAAVEELGNQWP